LHRFCIKTALFLHHFCTGIALFLHDASSVPTLSPNSLQENCTVSALSSRNIKAVNPIFESTALSLHFPHTPGTSAVPMNSQTRKDQHLYDTKSNRTSFVPVSYQFLGRDPSTPAPLLFELCVRCGPVMSPFAAHTQKKAAKSGQKRTFCRVAGC
jgi:hypothetical protein